METPKVSITVEYDDPEITDKQKRALAKALKHGVVAVLAVQSKGPVANTPQVNTR